MASRASVPREILFSNRRVGILMRFDGVNPMTVGADRREQVAARNRLPMNASVEGVLNIGVALTAGGGYAEFVDR